MHSLLHVIWGASKHVAFGYLIYSIIEHRQGRPLTDRRVVVLLFGVLFPDLVDKSLVVVGLLSYGRGFAHSLITASVLITVVYLITRRKGRPDLGRAFGLGYLLHIPIDLYGPLLTGHHPIDTAFLFWPVVTEYSLGVMPPDMPVSRNVIFGVIMIAAVGLWVYDGAPVVSGAVRFLRVRLAD